MVKTNPHLAACTHCATRQLVHIVAFSVKRFVSGALCSKCHKVFSVRHPNKYGLHAWVLPRPEGWSSKEAVPCAIEVDDEDLN